MRALVLDIPGYAVIGEANDGSQLLEMVEQLNPDIVLLDISMKETGGLEALQRQQAQLGPLSGKLQTCSGVEPSALRAENGNVIFVWMNSGLRLPLTINNPIWNMPFARSAPLASMSISTTLQDRLATQSIPTLLLTRALLYAVRPQLRHGNRGLADRGSNDICSPSARECKGLSSLTMIPSI